MGEFRHDGLAVPGQVVLARELPFNLGSLKVIPAIREVICGDRRETLEPRVMQVLVALARAKGAVVTRDELVETCWGGRIVTENAINRVISRVRQFGASFGDAFTVETITKVGYHLIVEGQPPPDLIPGSAQATRAPLTRRRAMIGLGAGTATALAGFELWTLTSRPPGRAEAEALVRKGRSLRSEGLPEDWDQALAYFREATRVDPTYADAWGYLALAEDSDAIRRRSAARRALDLDLDNAPAQFALLQLEPVYQHWASFERSCRSLIGRHPEFPSAQFQLGNLLCEVGRWKDAADILSKLTERERLDPIAHYRLALALWSADRPEDADNVLARAVQRWPHNGAVWSARFRILAFSGRARQALALMDDPASRPNDFDAATFQQLLTTAQALASGSAADIETAVSTNLEHLKSAPQDVYSAVANCAALGRVDEAFALCDGYFFGRGPRAQLLPAPENGGERTTMFLFYPWTASMRRDSRFGPMVREIGLEAYWRSAGTPPDYRRFA
jgi:tetratricopeptide (TPR) repeat protein